MYSRAKTYADFLLERVKANPSITWASVTLTLKQHLRRDDGTWQRLTSTETSKCVGRLLKRLSRVSLRAANRRFGKSLHVLPIIEGGRDKHIHVHMLLEIPWHRLQDTKNFFDLIRKEWSRLRWSDRQHQITILETDGDVVGWVHYILKDMNVTQDTIDLDNINL